ncbi:uncharacterized protein LOC122253146 [Penaeus japonicus]|uniref:uncharacterized protein LOC122253146 n=1 Tax=Penaeus japonicus TaxID=27405 RepID=UPI001C71151D|nr:uncharacterized protein LOC122253146 [Penaeus japonicus]XP_042871899.1 uncharacterized protein LOC122253146 [Penaeus japonicus]XP_042871900.1 uncharacterized protein LOC122253146 [Penaeus japonicus]
MASRPHPASGTAQLIKHTVNGFRYQVAVVTKGRAVFAQVVEWLYRGGPCVQTYFVSLGYTDADYRRKFNSEQRALLDRKAPFREYDISFLYIILQLMCGLANPNNCVWNSPKKGQPLEHLLYKIKQKRNNFAHSNDVQQMSDQKLIKEFKRLKCLFSRIIRLAGSQSGIRPNVYRDEVSEIKLDFRDLLQKVREPLQGSDLNLLPQLQQEIEVFKDILQRKLEDDCRKELHNLYPFLWDVTLAQWLFPDLKLPPSQNFTNLVLEEDLGACPPSWQQPRTVPHETLLEVTCGGQLAQVIIISGEGGIGKTTLLKYMLEMWVRDPSQIKGLRDVLPLMYLQLRGSNISSWKELFKNLLCNTFMESGLTMDTFLDVLHKMHVVVLLDGYDEANEKAKRLIDDLLNYAGNMRIVISTRPGDAQELTSLIGNKKQVMNVEIKGILREDRPRLVEGTLAALVREPSLKDKMKDKVLQHLERLALQKDELDIPLTVILLIVREVEAPDQSSENIYEELMALMTGKIEERLVLKGIEDANEKIRAYCDFQKEVAPRGVKRLERDVLEEGIASLKAKCISLHLPWREMLSGFLISK